MVKTLRIGPKKSKKSPLTQLGHFLKIVFRSPKMHFLGFEPRPGLLRRFSVLPISVKKSFFDLNLFWGKRTFKKGQKKIEKNFRKKFGKKFFLLLKSLENSPRPLGAEPGLLRRFSVLPISVKKSFFDLNLFWGKRTFKKGQKKIEKIFEKSSEKIFFCC